MVGVTGVKAALSVMVAAINPLKIFIVRLLTNLRTCDLARNAPAPVRRKICRRMIH
jgi:hypothetical protein